MKLSRIALLVCLLCAALGGECRNVRDFFASEPDDIFLLVPRTVRLDLMDYYDNGQRVELTNRMGNGTQLIDLDSTYVKVRTSASRVVELLMIPYTKRDTILAVIETVFTPVADSRLRFYNSNWVQLTSIQPLRPMPELGDLMLPTASRDKRRELLGRLPFTQLEMTFAGERHDTLVVRHNLQQFLSKEEYALFAPWMRSQISYRVGKKFTPIR